MPLMSNARRSRRRRCGDSGWGAGAVVTSLHLRHTQGIIPAQKATPLYLLEPIRNLEAKPACPAHLSAEMVSRGRRWAGCHPRAALWVWLSLDLNSFKDPSSLWQRDKVRLPLFFIVKIYLPPLPANSLYCHYGFKAKGQVRGTLGIREFEGKRAQGEGEEGTGDTGTGGLA